MFTLSSNVNYSFHKWANLTCTIQSSHFPPQLPSGIFSSFISRRHAYTRAEWQTGESKAMFRGESSWPLAGPYRHGRPLSLSRSVVSSTQLNSVHFRKPLPAIASFSTSIIWAWSGNWESRWPPTYARTHPLLTSIPLNLYTFYIERGKKYLRDIAYQNLILGHTANKSKSQLTSVVWSCGRVTWHNLSQLSISLYPRTD